MRAFLMVKPGNAKLIVEIFRRIHRDGLTILSFTTITFTKQQAGEFYSPKADMGWFDELTDYLSSGFCYLIVVEGDDALNRLLRIKGKTWSGKGIRGEFAESYIYNIVHCADTQEENDKEFAVLSSIA